MRDQLTASGQDTVSENVAADHAGRVFLSSLGSVGVNGFQVATSGLLLDDRRFELLLLGDHSLLLGDETFEAVPEIRVGYLVREHLELSKVGQSSCNGNG